MLHTGASTAARNFAEYDLIRGLTGLGVALRCLSGHDQLRDVLDYLVRLTEPFGDLPGWWSCNGPDRNQTPPLGGHANHGVAHGIAGPLALLALAYLDGIVVCGHIAAIARICAWLDQWQQLGPNGIWWPQTLTLGDLRRGNPAQQRPLRPSWCYGTPGVARAQQLAARALNDTPRQNTVETAFITCVSDPAQVGRLIDRSLCHGTAGLLATGRRIAADALNPVPLIPLIRLHQRRYAPDGEPTGLLVGAAGANLANTLSTAWDACLLLS